MKFIVLIVGLCAVIFPSGLPCFEAVFSIILLLPAVYYLLAAIAAGSHLLIPFESPILHWVSLLLLVVFVYILGRRCRGRQQPVNAGDDGVSLILFIVAFGLSYRLCLLWPDFYPIGERLRDYAVLSSVIDSPTAPGEPWLAATPLHYYTYWYRLGAAFSALFTLKPWTVYHCLVAFSFALYLSCIFLFCRRHLQFSRYSSLVSALIIACGANVAGLYTALTLTVDTKWWSVSRVIPGTINEFPAWSFVLGDLHPHFMNLPFLPLAATVYLTAQRYVEARSPIYYLFNTITFAVLPFLFAWNGNSWDAPIWLGFAGVSMMVVFLYRVLAKETGTTALRPKPVPFSLAFTLATALFLAGICSSFLIMGSTSQPAAKYTLALVSSAVGRTGLADLLRHWGIALSIITICLLYLPGKATVKSVFLACAGLAIYLNSALIFLIALWMFNIIRLGKSWQCDAGSTGRSKVALIMEATGIGALGLLIIPELVYVNDAYAGPYERMNTIFKIYSINWFPLHIFAIYLASQAYRRCVGFFSFLPKFKMPLLFLLCLAMSAFFIQAIAQRIIPPPEIAYGGRGLGKIEAKFPGAAETIEYLADMPMATVIEGQSPAYSYATHVATLASQPAYLGWTNHLFLLSPFHEEIQRRIRMTERIYDAKTPCDQRRQLMVDEHIAYLVWGPIEKEHYGRALNNGLGCLEPLFAKGRYTIYSPGGMPGQINE